MNTVLHYVRLNYALMLFLVAVLTVVCAVTYAMVNTFGAYALIFLALSSWSAHVLSAGFINFTLGA